MTEITTKVHPSGRVIHKGVNPDIDSYSAFFDNAKLGKTNLEELIRKEGCMDTYICGIATDVCVGMSPFYMKVTVLFLTKLDWT